MTRILSFDVGIKNLAYCILEKIQDDEFMILDWGTINLVSDTYNCQYQVRGGKFCSAKAVYNICSKSKKLGYQGPNTCKAHCDKLMPQLVSICHDTECCMCTKPATITMTGGMYSWCDKHKKQAEQYISKITVKKIGKASQQPPQDLNVKLIKSFETRRNFLDVDEVLIENQPSLKNPVMKSIAAYIHCWFVDHGVLNSESRINKVSYISPSNKLKKLNKVTMTYKDTKNMGIECCRKLISEKDLSTLEQYKKKDDMCDAFLQAFQYIFDPIPQKYIDLL